MFSAGKSPSSIATAQSRPARRIQSSGFHLLFYLLGMVLPLWAQAPQALGPAHSTELPALLRVAEEAISREDFRTALKALKSAVEIEPKLTAAWFNLAYAYSGLHQNEQAVQAYQKTLELQPDLFEARFNLGILLIEMKRAGAAREHLQEAVLLKPQHARAHLYYGRALGLADQPEAAEKQFQESLRLDPGLTLAHFEVGQLCLAQKRYTDARAAFQKAAELDPKLAPAQLGMARASEGLNQLAEAVTSFEKYLSARPDDHETRFHLARIYLQQGKNEQALGNLQAVYQASPELPGLATALGEVCALLKRFPESEKFYRQALAASPGQADLHRALGQTLLDEGKLTEAESEFRASLQLDRQAREAAQGLATSLYLQKRYAETVPLLEALVRGPQPFPGLFFVLATCYDHLRDRPKAVEAYERFLELSQGKSPNQEWQARQRVKLLRRGLRK